MAAEDQIDGTENKLHSRPIAIIEPRTLFRECMAQCIGNDLGCAVETFRDFESWRDASMDASPSMIVVGISGAVASNDHRYQDIVSQFVQMGKGAPIVVLSDSREFDQIAASLRAGARGFIPTDSSLSATVGAMRLVLVGGVFVPAEALLAGATPTG